MSFTLNHKLCAGMADSAIQQMVTEVLTSVLGAQPGLEMPLVQAGLDSLGEQYTPYGAFHVHGSLHIASA